MIFIGMGANLMHPVYGEPVNSLKAAIRTLEQPDLMVIKRSSWYKTAPVPVSDQPWFVNNVIEVETSLPMEGLLSRLHEVEKEFGRVREVKWEARVLDLDLLAYDNQITLNQDQTKGSVVPHPFMQERAFVLAPLAEIAPDWVHPTLQQSAAELLARLSPVQAFEIVPD
ncbi:2-amino-4-hydroxy-6-hydroxymethyldihydropteridine diphosphokinase [Sneathiella sp.]|jgi:2-amino-4-hydroxy-6-hydroxymethyldihydropteridine diphosphokinase|uniref:2-amino-4-hydroxy-6- hydroxymethyldihydropteridine diphosphokinase n=1 Tax=Sneathiella sp. TaxID=1964365 RepID=UPI0039E65109